MNYKRIEWIFFVAFIMLTVFLVSSYFKQGPIMDATANHPEFNTVSVLKSMRDDQITIGETSNETGTGYYVSSPNNDDLKNKASQLRYHSWSMNGNLLNSTFATMIKVNADNTQNILKSIVTDQNTKFDRTDHQ